MCVWEWVRRVGNVFVIKVKDILSIKNGYFFFFKDVEFCFCLEIVRVFKGNGLLLLLVYYFFNL